MQLYSWQTEYLKNLSKNVIMTAETGMGKTFMALSHIKYDLPILVIAPPAKVNSNDWQNLAKELNKIVTVVSFGKITRLATPLQNYILIIDECHYAKNATAKRSKAVIRLATDKNCKQFIGLSATAIPNGFIDLQTYGIIFGWWKNKTDFIRKHVLIDRSRGFPRIIGYREENRLKQLWQSVAFSLDKVHLNLPDLINITTTINLTKKQSDEYHTIKRTRVLADGTMLDTPSKLHATLRQYLSTTRTQALEMVLDDTHEHILIFYSYNASRQAILDTVSKYDRVIYEQSGHASNLPNGIPNKPSVTLLQYQSGSVGLNLQYAPISIFYEPSYSWMDTEQAKGRNWRGGQDKIVRHYWFKVDRTLDVSIYSCLERKTNFNENILEEEQTT